MRGEDRFVAHFYRASNFACKARGGGGGGAGASWGVPSPL